MGVECALHGCLPGSDFFFLRVEKVIYSITKLKSIEVGWLQI